MSQTTLKMPQLSMTMLDGVIAKWLKNTNDYVAQDEPLVEIESDKVTSTVNSPVSGYLLKILVKDFEVAKVNEPICVFGDAISENADLDNGYIQPNAEQSETIEIRPVLDNNNKIRISPLAKKIALENNIDIDTLNGTGPGKLIVKKDVLEKINQQSSDFQSTPKKKVLETIPFQGTRKTTAQHLMNSKKETAAVTTFAEVDLTEIKNMRRYLPISYTTAIAKATALAIKDFRALNSRQIEDKIVLYKSINLNIAVSTGDSLITPVVEDVDELDILSLNQRIGRLADRARSSQLTNEDFEGGTFTITNSGVFGSLFFTPIINYPQCAILGMGKIKDTVVIKEGKVSTIPQMILCLSYDHRLVDGETAVRFLQKIIDNLQNPKSIVLGEQSDAK